MKKLNTLEDVKSFSISLQKFFKEKSIDIKHSIMLEAIAKAFNLSDWNTLSAKLQNTSPEKWDIEQYIHIDNGGYDLYYDKSNEILKIDIGFFGYSHHSQKFHLSQQDFQLLRLDLLNFQQILLKEDAALIEAFFKKARPHYNNEVEFGFSFKEETLVFKTPLSTLFLTQIYNKETLGELISFTQKVLDICIYPLETALLSSMAMRYDHSYGIMDEKDRYSLLEKMEKLYFLYAKGLSNEDIVKQFPIDHISVKQVREETNGEGFYKPGSPKNKY